MSSPDRGEQVEDGEEDLPNSEETLEGNPTPDELFSLDE